MGHVNNTSGSSLSETQIINTVKHVIDIGVLEEERLSERSIYKVPCNLRKVKVEAYTPQCISIGPIHLGRKQLKPMQQHKLRYFLLFWKRVSNEQAILEKYKHYLETKEENIRLHYAEKFTMAKEKFVDMILLDAVFIMELFLRNRERKSDNSKHSDDVILTQSWLSWSIARDLTLLENQIPFSVLQELYDNVVPLSNKKEEHSTGFADLATNYFAIFYDTLMSSAAEIRKHFLCGSVPALESNNMLKEPEHFTDLIRSVYLQNNIEHKRGHANHVLRTATKLLQSGVSFKKGDEKRRLLEIAFEKNPILSKFLCFGCLPYFKARLIIPQLKVDHTTECVFRNLIAFEQCHYPEEAYFCNYVSFIDSLIHTQLDVELLVEKEVIVHELGSDKEVATLVNGLCKHVVTNSTCYYETINDLNKHYMNNWNHTVAALRLAYFRDLWRASSTVVGIAVLVFAVYQFLNAVGAF